MHLFKWKIKYFSSLPISLFPPWKRLWECSECLNRKIAHIFYIITASGGIFFLLNDFASFVSSFFSFFNACNLHYRLVVTQCYSRFFQMWKLWDGVFIRWKNSFHHVIFQANHSDCSTGCKNCRWVREIWICLYNVSPSTENNKFNKFQTHQSFFSFTSVIFACSTLILKDFLSCFHSDI